MYDLSRICLGLHYTPHEQSTDFGKKQSYSQAQRIYENGLNDAKAMRHRVANHPFVVDNTVTADSMKKLLDDAIFELKRKQKGMINAIIKLNHRIEDIDGDEMESVSVYKAPGSFMLKPPPAPLACPTTPGASFSPFAGASTAAPFFGSSSATSTSVGANQTAASSSGANFGGTSQNTSGSLAASGATNHSVGSSFGIFGAPVPPPPPATPNPFAGLTSTAASTQSSQIGSSFGGGCGTGGNNNGTSPATNPFAGLRTTTPTQSFSLFFGSSGAASGGISQNSSTAQTCHSLVSSGNLKNATKENLAKIAHELFQTKDDIELKKWIRQAYTARDLHKNKNAMANRKTKYEHLLKLDLRDCANQDGRPMSVQHKKLFWKIMTGEE